MLKDQSVVEQLGPEAVDGPNTAKTEDTANTHSSTCEWESLHPPNLGPPANGKITVSIRVSLDENGAPDPRAAEEKFRMDARGTESADSPADSVGDQSRNAFEPGPTQPGVPSAGQVATIDFVRANAYVTVEFRAWGSAGLSKAYLPQDAQAEATRRLANEVSDKLGEPR